MVDRRTLAQGLKETPTPLPAAKEQEFVYGAEPKVVRATPAPSSAPINTRMRADFVTALKRASLQRQLEGVTPNTLRDILEDALEPWLRDHGHLP